MGIDVTRPDTEALRNPGAPTPRRATIVCVGEILWDVFPDGRRIGGAPFNVAAHARRLGAEVFFVSGVGDDALGREALRRVRELQLDPRYVSTVAGTPTGTVDVWLAGGQPDFKINLPAAYDHPALSDAQARRIASAAPQWIYFGTLGQMSDGARDITRRLIAAAPAAGRFYDVNLRKGGWTPALVETLLGDATALKLNADEMREVGGIFGVPSADVRGFCAGMAGRFALDTVCVTRGAGGCALWRNGAYAEAPGIAVRLVDAVGAGDAFCAVLMTGLARGGGDLAGIAAAANRMGAWVASRAGAIPEPDADP